MGLSLIDAQRDIILGQIHHITKHDWKVLVVDRDSRRLLDNVIDEDALMNENITNIEQITERRQTNRDVDALYFLTPQPHIVDCVMADFQKRKYKRAHLIWTSLLHPALRDRIDQSQIAREQIAQFTVLNVEYYPRESHLVTFRDPWSFPILFHPACNQLVRQHMEDTAQKIVGVCVALGEYPTIRYYRPRAPTHEASILCSHLARFVQDELDLYAKFHHDFPPATTRPRGSLYILDRTIDLLSPLVHEFTYQAMAHDLLPIQESDKITYRVTINEGQQDQEVKDIAITEKDKIWLENRHRHMKDVIEKLMADFQRFIKDNPNFTNKAGDEGGNSLNAIKDMLAGLPQFQERKEAYALHLGMAQECMNRFQAWKLGELSTVEQTCAAGVDEDHKKPKHLADAVIRMLDEDDITPPDRLRLLLLYLLYRDGLLPADLQKLLNHANLPSQDAQAITNLSLLGARTTRQLKDPRPSPLPIFPTKPPPPPNQLQTEEDFLSSRFAPALQFLLESHALNTVPADIFPYTKPPLDLPSPSDPTAPHLQSTTSLRSTAKPTWASNKSRTPHLTADSRPRVIVFMAGGATYAEARACYDVGRQTGKEVVLATSHMLTPQLFVRQVGDLSAERRRLGIPADAPKPKAPPHLFEPDEAPKPVQVPAPAAGARLAQGSGLSTAQMQAQARPAGPRPPEQGMANMSLNGRPNGQQGQAPQANSSAKLTKERDRDREGDGGKKRHHFGFGRKG